MPLEVAGQTAVVADPAQRPFDDPALRQHDEAVLVAAADDLDPASSSVTMSDFRAACQT